MTELKTFNESVPDSFHQSYEDINKSINKYAQEKGLYIKTVHYDRFRDKVVANVLFSTIPDELFVL